MHDPILAESALQPLDDELRRRIGESSPPYDADPDDPSYGAAFRRHLLFLRWPELLEAVAPGLDDLDRFYNTYYWVLKFSKLHQKAHGYDAGLEQQAFQVLEGADCDFDWSVVEAIGNRVDAEVGGRGG